MYVCVCWLARARSNCHSSERQIRATQISCRRRCCRRSRGRKRRRQQTHTHTMTTDDLLIHLNPTQIARARRLARSLESALICTGEHACACANVKSSQQQRRRQQQSQVRALHSSGALWQLQLRRRRRRRQRHATPHANPVSLALRANALLTHARALQELLEASGFARVEFDNLIRFPVRLDRSARARSDGSGGLQSATRLVSVARSRNERTFVSVFVCAKIGRRSRSSRSRRAFICSQRAYC